MPTLVLLVFSISLSCIKNFAYSVLKRCFVVVVLKDWQRLGAEGKHSAVSIKRQAWSATLNM